MSQVTPIGPSVGHVQVQNGHTETVQVLVEDALKRSVDKDATLVEAWTTPRVETTSLELKNAVRRIGALLLVQPLPVCWERPVGPNIRVGTVEAQRVPIVAVDVYHRWVAGRSRNRRVVTSWTCII